MATNKVSLKSTIQVKINLIVTVLYIFFESHVLLTLITPLKITQPVKPPKI